MSRFFVKIYPAAIVVAFPIAAFSQNKVEKNSVENFTRKTVND
jgi:hypothetical protein